VTTTTRAVRAATPAQIAGRAAASGMPAVTAVVGACPDHQPDRVERTVLGVATGHRDTSTVEELLDDLIAAGLPPGAVLCTHLVRCTDLRPEEIAAGAGPQVAVSVDVPGPVGAAAAAAVAAAFDGTVLQVLLLAGDAVAVSTTEAPSAARLPVTEALTGTGGRAVLFPGSTRLPGRVTVAEVLDCTAIDTVRGVGGVTVTGSDTIWTRDFLRPVYTRGRLVLEVQTAAGGVLVGFEDPSPTACCAAHSPRRPAGPHLRRRVNN